MMVYRLMCATLCWLALGPAAWGEPTRYVMAPGTVQVGFRAYGLGMLPIDGAFTRFRGTLTLDGADPAVCAVSLKAEAGSLRMSQQAMTDDALGPDLLDVARYPDFEFEGACRDGRLVGSLLLHGVTRPMVFDVSVAGGKWHASGMMRRAEWGMGARPLLAGPEVRITVTAGLPAGRGH